MNWDSILDRKRHIVFLTVQKFLDKRDKGDGA